MDMQTQAELETTKKEKAAYEKALEKLDVLTKELQQDLHAAHPFHELVMAHSCLRGRISGCDALIKRIEVLGR